ncbi:MAG: GGDEF domain-containing protein, partial [Peptococcaceae bacterium]|nr:GGDEF domain-containing protein [Peptococcaceae bacterium]
SLWGLVRVGLIVLQLLLAFWLIISGQGNLFKVINSNILPVNLHALTSLSQISLILFLITLTILVIRHVIYKSYQDIAFIGVLVALFLGLDNHKNLLLSAIFFAAAGIILIISIVQVTYSMAFFDELTGLPSRRALNQDMLQLGMKYVIAMLDIDFFKKFNDTYGHDTGDEVLKLVASILKNIMGGGKCYRYGGEEFTILFPGKNVEDVLPYLEELRQAISQRGFTPRSKDRLKSKPKGKPKNAKQLKQIFITVSIGVSPKKENLKTPDAVLKAADAALYRAKKKGRNCVSK